MCRPFPENCLATTYPTTNYLSGFSSQLINLQTTFKSKYSSVKNKLEFFMIKDTIVYMINITPTCFFQPDLKSLSDRKGCYKSNNEENKQDLRSLGTKANFSIFSKAKDVVAISD